MPKKKKARSGEKPAPAELLNAWASGVPIKKLERRFPGAEKTVRATAASHFRLSDSLLEALVVLNARLGDRYSEVAEPAFIDKGLRYMQTGRLQEIANGRKSIGEIINWCFTVARIAGDGAAKTGRRNDRDQEPCAGPGDDGKHHDAPESEPVRDE